MRPRVLHSEAMSRRQIADAPDSASLTGPDDPNLSVTERLLSLSHSRHSGERGQFRRRCAFGRNSLSASATGQLRLSGLGFAHGCTPSHSLRMPRIRFRYAKRPGQLTGWIAVNDFGLPRGRFSLRRLGAADEMPLRCGVGDHDPTLVGLRYQSYRGLPHAVRKRASFLISESPRR